MTWLPHCWLHFLSDGTLTVVIDLKLPSKDENNPHDYEFKLVFEKRRPVLVFTTTFYPPKCWYFDEVGGLVRLADSLGYTSWSF